MVLIYIYIFTNAFIFTYVATHFAFLFFLVAREISALLLKVK
ncbi:hypothetical protein, unlikely [Trypanosoma brucei gambiense DAL972]|uniref:Uncharacterized protein n=1 Tax=Trypanosoma brucei gambiense (strain MHOM/CI/86/DAL972) TaxID=679716 RepID=C9ZHZ1_TRYB9|nr:hypothetical protein, unlikely [Trypanosoma brucei gambiense DAL972]CBH09108.1 hypothetical protein, unlikely [Trypanosoma brucei gambiense DAL972]|eukprot:XP_011771549.1 hypothetical protein, unlikely [Trypanosoma brucei gambiense DAL972]